jgi:hypothetical protein
MLWTFLAVFVIGLCLIIGGLIAIIKTKHGVLPAIVTLIGIYVAFFLPNYVGGPEGILIDSTTQWWVDIHEVAGYIAFIVLMVTLFTDLAYTMWADGRESSTLSQYNKTYTDDDAGRKEKADDERQEKFFLVIALIVSLLVGTIFHHVMSSPSHILLEVTRAAHVKGYPVQLNPFIIEMPAERFTAATLESLTNGAQNEGRAAGLNDFKIDKVYSLRFISRDNNVIDEVILMFDGTHLVENETEDPNDPTKVVKESTKVAFTKATISVPRPGTEEETNAFGAAMLSIVQNRSATSGSGLSGIPRSTSPSSYAPITVEAQPIEITP